MLAGLIIRRFVMKPKGLEIVRDDYVVLPLLFLILINGFLLEGTRLAATDLNADWVRRMEWTRNSAAFRPSAACRV